jgi:cell division protein FtsB
MSSRAAIYPSPRLRSYVPTVVMGAICLYFAFYMLFGPRGYFALQRVHENLHQQLNEYQVLKTERKKLAADVQLMRPDSLDADMADEQARKTLGYMKPDEIVIDLQ